MKVLSVLLLVAVVGCSANAVKHLKSKIVDNKASVYEAEVSFKVGIKAVPTHLTKAQQTVQWAPLAKDFSLVKKGYTQWKSAKAGMLVKGAKDTLSCKVDGSSNKAARTASFLCAKQSPGDDQSDPTFWRKCDGAGARPQGWNQQWGNFDYPFYAIAPNGFYGCSELTTDGYCIDPYYYSSDAYNPDDLMSSAARPSLVHL